MILKRSCLLAAAVTVATSWSLSASFAGDFLPIGKAPVGAGFFGFGKGPPPGPGPCLRFNVAEWSWYDYCWWERHPVAWRTYRVPVERVAVEK